MTSILKEIYELRNRNPISIDRQNTNRYRVVICEDDGSKTAYYFSCPIYNLDTGRAISMKFQKLNNEIIYYGSNGKIVCSDKIELSNSNGKCEIMFPHAPKWKSDGELSCDDASFYCTTNGILCKFAVRSEKEYKIIIDIKTLISGIRANDRYFSCMIEGFRPLLTIATIGEQNQNGNITAPLLLKYKKLANQKYEITFSASLIGNTYGIFEINLYENKLIQDTTVESKNPTLNNVFGAISFIGKTNEFGEQWLYSKFDYPKINEMHGYMIKKAILHLPALNETVSDIKAIGLNARFCSFGSNWENKISKTSSQSTYSITNYKYIDLDITDIITNRYHQLIHSEGMIIKNSADDNKYCVISTADSCAMPQILEINFK